MALEEHGESDESTAFKKYPFFLSAPWPDGKIRVECKAQEVFPNVSSGSIPALQLKYDHQKSTWMVDDQKSMYLHPDGSAIVNVDEAIRRANNTFPHGPDYPRSDTSVIN
ncbi:hypothetical protein HZA40_02610 [Candidatus Peregrinibacteria bacterium]|nr:hypothetical protein [Candidatus Peregrinibacteria bacterium]